MYLANSLMLLLGFSSTLVAAQQGLKNDFHMDKRAAVGIFDSGMKEGSPENSQGNVFLEAQRLEKNASMETLHDRSLELVGRQNCAAGSFACAGMTSPKVPNPTLFPLTLQSCWRLLLQRSPVLHLRLLHGHRPNMLSRRLLSSRQHMLRRLNLQPDRHAMLQRRQLLQRREHLRHLLWPPRMLYRSLLHCVHLERGDD